MIRLGRNAERQVAALLWHFTQLERPDASGNLIAAIDRAAELIERNPAAGLPAPRPYPSLAGPGRKWIMVHRYWIAYSTEAPTTILAVFDATADIPGRV